MKLIYSCICSKFASCSEEEVQAHFIVHRDSYEKGERYEKRKESDSANAQT